MTQLVHADIFFFITSVVVIVIGVGIAVVLLLAGSILYDIHIATKKLRMTSKHIAEDIEAFRKGFVHDATHLRKVVLSIIGHVTARAYRRYTRHKKKRDKQKE